MRHVEIVQLLLASPEIDVNRVGIDAETALSIARENASTHIFLPDERGMKRAEEVIKIYHLLMERKN